MTKEELKITERAREVLKGMNGNAKGLVLDHVRQLQHEQLTKLASHVDPHQLYRAQGAIKAYQSIIELFDGSSGM